MGENQSLLLCRDLDCCVYSVHGCCVAEHCCMLHKLNAFCWYMQFVVCCMVPLVHWYMDAAWLYAERSGESPPPQRNHPTLLCYQEFNIFIRATLPNGFICAVPSKIRLHTHHNENLPFDLPQRKSLNKKSAFCVWWGPLLQFQIQYVQKNV